MLLVVEDVGRSPSGTPPNVDMDVEERLEGEQEVELGF